VTAASSHVGSAATWSPGREGSKWWACGELAGRPWGSQGFQAPRLGGQNSISKAQKLNFWALKRTERPFGGTETVLISCVWSCSYCTVPEMEIFQLAVSMSVSKPLESRLEQLSAEAKGHVKEKGQSQGRT